MNKTTSAAIVAATALAFAGCLDPDFYVDYNEPPPPAVVHPTVVQPTVVQPVPAVVQPVPTGDVQPVYVYPNGGHSGSIRPPRHRSHDDDYRRGGRHDDDHHDVHHGKATSGQKARDYASSRPKPPQQQTSQPAKPVHKVNQVSPFKVMSQSKTPSKAVPQTPAKQKTPPKAVPKTPPKKPATPPKNPPPKKK